MSCTVLRGLLSLHDCARWAEEQRGCCSAVGSRFCLFCPARPSILSLTACLVASTTAHVAVDSVRACSVAINKSLLATVAFDTEQLNLCVGVAQEGTGAAQEGTGAAPGPVQPVLEAKPEGDAVAAPAESKPETAKQVRWCLGLRPLNPRPACVDSLLGRINSLSCRHRPCSVLFTPLHQQGTTW